MYRKRETRLKIQGIEIRLVSGGFFFIAANVCAPIVFQYCTFECICAVQYRMFAVLVLLSCTVDVKSVLYMGNSSSVFLRGIISSPSDHFEKQRVATGGTE